MPNSIPTNGSKKRRRLGKIRGALTKNQVLANRYRSSSNWQKVRKLFIYDNPMCEDVFSIHRDEKTTEPAKEIHHIRSVSTHYWLRNTEINLSSQCVSCHHKISALETQNKPTYHLFKR